MEEALESRQQGQLLKGKEWEKIAGDFFHSGWCSFEPYQGIQVEAAEVSAHRPEAGRGILHQSQAFEMSLQNGFIIST